MIQIGNLYLIISKFFIYIKLSPHGGNEVTDGKGVTLILDLSTL